MARIKGELTRCNNTMTESAYLAWIRSALRSKSLRWPPRTQALELNRKPYKGANRLQKWVYTCVLCNKEYKAKDVVVDHHPKPAGSILSVQDIGPFAENLFCEVDNLRVLCKPCHDVHTLAEKNGISFKEAETEKRVIEICKTTKSSLAFLLRNGYTGTAVSNAVKRKALVTKILKEK